MALCRETLGPSKPIHLPDPQVPVEESWGRYVQLMETGLHAVLTARRVSVERLLTLTAAKPGQDGTFRQALAAHAAECRLPRRATALSWAHTHVVGRLSVHVEPFY